MATFMLFYQFLLEKENMHQFKRFFLLGALTASLIIPGLVFTEYVEAVALNTESATTEIQAAAPINEDPITDIDVINWSLLFWSIYLLGFLAFAFRFAKHLFQILNRIQKNPKLKENFTIRVLLKEKMPPHTFFSYIFLNKSDLENSKIPKEVILHEETHAKQKHSFDVLFIEFLQVLLWFNPLLLLYKRCIKLNHEFLADSAVLKEKKNTKNYQNTLLSYLSQDNATKNLSIQITIEMTSAINYSSIKKRFNIMKKRTSPTAATFRTLLLLPIIAILLFGFSERKVLQKGASREQMKEYNMLAEKYSNVHTIILKKDVDRMKYLHSAMSEKQKESALSFPRLPEPPPIQKGASREQMKEYNSLAEKYNEMPKNNMRILGKEVKRMEYIYSLMSEKQKADAEPFPNLPEPPPPPPAPKVDDIKEVPPPSRVPAPPAPPTPPNPLDHVVEMAKKGLLSAMRMKKFLLIRLLN